MAFLVRSVHLGSVSFVLGGAILLVLIFYFARHDPALTSTTLLKLMQAYEFGFWAAMGLLVATGIGNVAHFGDALPEADTTWGGRFFTKLLLVLVLLLFSGVRALTLATAGARPEVSRSALATMEGLYGATAIFLIGIVGLAVALAHF